MKANYRLLIFILFFTSCAKDSDPSGELNGTYSGIYLQTGDMKDTATVRIVFIGSSFSGESSGGSRGICNGSYNVFGDSISFRNLCAIPDTDLILAGRYKMTTTGDSLYFTRSYPLGIVANFDTFYLRKQ